MRNILLIAAFILMPILVSCNNQDKAANSESTSDSSTEAKTAPNEIKDGDIDTEKLKSFFLNKYGAQLPPDISLSVAEITASDVNGFKKGAYDVEVPNRGKQAVPFLVSNDGRYLIIGANTPIDLSNFEDSPIKGLKQGSISLGRGPAVPVLILDNGKSMLVGELLDTSIDPLKEVTDKISMINVPVKGNENAKITVVEYSDFQCPFCKRGAEMLPELLNEYKDSIKVIYKQLPLANHQWAKPASIAALCTFEQGGDKFWSFHDSVFGKQQEINVDNSSDKLKEIAQSTGLDVETYEKCIQSPEIAERVQADIKEAQSIGVSSTPTFVVDGIIVPGANLPALKNAIESRLSQGG
ncbi:MAG: DsbA family protein [Thermodesulfobacteriota bacterium]